MDTAVEPSHLSPPRRKRKRTATSRNGCLRCKTRRIRCDEGRPVCGNCLRLKINCPGYGVQLRWSTKHERTKETEVQRARDEGSGPSWQKQRQLPVVNTDQGDLDQQFGVEIVPGTLLENTRLPLYDETSWMADATTTAQETDPTYDVESVWSSNIDVLPSATFYLSRLEIPRSPTHLPTILIEYWFRYICPMRSTFDSDINYNRLLAGNTWSASEAVCYTMQTMAAACLAQSMPQLRAALPTLTHQALAATHLSVSRVRSSPQAYVPSDLIFAVFALGTSLHWSGSTSSPVSQQQPWLELAGELLSRWSATVASRQDTLINAYFSQALIYWEMLLAVVGKGSFPRKIAQKRRLRQQRLRRALDLTDEPVSDEDQDLLSFNANSDVRGTRPNSWCGVSSEIISVFGQVLSLCRSVILRDQDSTTSTLESASMTLCDISLARDIQRDLTAMDFGILVLLEEAQGHPVLTKDQNTPVDHLLQTAEAFRQAALLQLYLAFEDLVPLAQEQGVMVWNGSTGADVVQTREQWILGLTLRLSGLLECIPPGSGSRSIHPILYLSAAAGLRYVETPYAGDITINSGDIFQSPLPDIAVPLRQAMPLLDNMFEEPLVSVNLGHTAGSLSHMEVSKARQTVWTRLSGIQHMLPHGSSQNILQLVKDIWQRYDDASSAADKRTHWLHVLHNTHPDTLLW
ncbi:hypothetical protein IQ07DRAFT_225331 [Pyrenochaeta sp. DS3sAY3a]|nr:hypothetical protein IQ07DRAFT_225331 [Pyrenochaeta sp. DS3sAY3a]